MDHTFNKLSLESKRKALRQKMPQPEIMVWSKLRNRQLNGFKFKRQYSVGNYILDFYCPSDRLAIELDGDSHFRKSAKEKDQIRDNYLEALHINVLRFTNKEITENLEGVLEAIIKVLGTSPSLS